jgi:CubicO group peptidase (beta-lactamase class C family)
MSLKTPHIRFTLLLWAIAAGCSDVGTGSGLSEGGLSNALPLDVGVSSERLELIDQMLLESIDKGEIPGAVALIARHGKIVYHKAFGTANIETDETNGRGKNG